MGLVEDRHGFLAAGVEGLRRRRADVLAGAVLLCASLVWSGLTWGRLYDPIMDQGWHMQASARVASGEVLYRDLIWMYGPLPIYLQALLFRLLGTNVTAFLLLMHGLAAAGCLLTYTVARSLVKPPLALAGTVALFLGGWWGGFLGYSQSYSAAVPLGAVAGLVFAACLLAYLRGGGLVWAGMAGVASALALLTKPEFGVACAATGLVGLTGLALFPRALAGDRVAAPRALGAFAGCMAAVLLVGYGPLVWQAGWENVWLGITGYDQDAILLQEWPPWGTPEAWLYITSGLGVYLVGSVCLGAVAAPRAAGKRLAGLVWLGGLGCALAVLPWRRLASMRPVLVASMRSSLPVLIEQGIRVLWAPGTVILTALLLVLGAAWIRAHRRRQPLSLAAGSLAVLALYTALANLRSYLYPTGTFHFMFLDTLFPVLLTLAAVVLPLVVAKRWRAPVRRTHVHRAIGLAMAVYAVAGLIWSADLVSQQTASWSAPRGTALYNGDSERRQAWPALLQQILDRTEPGDPIAILGPEPGFYFWTGRANPLRQDTVLPRMETSREDAEEMVRRLERAHPRLVAIPQGVTYGLVWFWNLDAGEQARSDLGPVWDYVRENFRFELMAGGDKWGYAIYMPLE